MFGLISKKKLIEVAVDTYLKNDTSKAGDTQTFYYGAGNANALNYLCYKLGVDLTKEVKKAKERSEGE